MTRQEYNELRAQLDEIHALENELEELVNEMTDEDTQEFKRKAVVIREAVIRKLTRQERDQLTTVTFNS